jgi:hypothetical protein
VNFFFVYNSKMGLRDTWQGSITPTSYIKKLWRPNQSFKHLTPVVNDVSFSKCVIENQIQL